MRKRYELLVLLILTGLSLIAVQHYTRDFYPQEVTNMDEPDYYGQQLKSFSYNAQGMLTETFYAKKSVHYPGKQVVEVTQPHLITVNQEGEVTTLTSDHGTLTESKDTIDLHGNVLVKSGDTEAPVLLRTDTLHYDNKAQIAQTDQKVVITHLNSTTQGTGMIYDVSQQSVELLSGVRSRYVPQPNTQ